MESSKYWERRALARLTNTERNSAIATRRLKAMYNQANRDLKKSIDNIYKNYSKDTGLDIQTLKTLLSKSETDAFWKTLEGQGLKKYVKNNYKSRITRLEQIQAELYAKCKELAPKEELLTREAYAHTIKSTYDRTIYDTAKGTGYDIAFNTVDNRTINALLSERWAGGNYSSRVWTNTDILADTVSTIVGGGLISGMSLSKMTADVQDAVGGGYSRANRLVRTEANRFNNEAEALAYEELGVDKYVFIATLDSRTSPMCQEMDNKIIDFKDKEVGVNYPPLHPYCRSTVRPYIDEEAERHIRRKARDPKTGKVVEIGNISYRDWIAGKTEPPKAKAIKKISKTDNKITLDPTKGIATTYSSNIADIEAVLNSSNHTEAKQVIAKYINEVTIANSNYRGTSCYSPLANGLELNPKDIGDTGYQYKWETLVHESGHWIDKNNIGTSGNSFKRAMYRSVEYNNGEFANTIKAEVEDLVKAEYEIVKENWAKYVTTEPEKLVDLGYVDWIDYRWYGDKALKLSKSMAYKSLEKKLYGTISNGYDRACISDIIEGATRGKIRLGYGHGSKYWTDPKNLPIEAFAEFLESAIANEGSYEVLKTYLPNSEKVFTDILKDMIK